MRGRWWWGWLLGWGWLISAWGSGLTPVVVQLKWQHQFQFAGYYAALAQGYYRTAGLNVQLRAALPQTDVVDEVVSGRAQIGVGSSSLLLRYAQGAPVVVLGVIFQHSPWALAARNDGQSLLSLHDLAGKKLLINPDASELAAYLQAEGVKAQLVRATNFDPIDALRGEIRAQSVYVSNELFTLKSQKIPITLFSPRAAGIDFYGDNFFTSQTWLQKNPEAVAAFRQATFKGWQYALQHPQEMIELIRREYNFTRSPAHLAFEAEQIKPLIQAESVEMGYMYQGRWEHIAQTYQRLGLLKQSINWDDFLYQAPKPPWFDRHTTVSLWLVLGIATLLAVLTSIRFYRLNRRLQENMQARTQVTQQLRASETQLRAIVETSSAAVLVTDVQGCLQFVNPQASTMFMCSLAALLGREYLSLVHPEEKAVGGQLVARLLRGDVPSVSVERRYVRSDGSVFWGHLSGGRLLTPDNQLQGLVVVIADISDRKQAEDALRRLNTTLEVRIHEEIEKNREKDALLLQQARLAAMGEMIHNIAHQWRQPLNALALVVANLEDAWAYHELDDALLHQSARKADQLIQSMSTTIDDFRNFFRPDKAAINFEITPVVHETLSLLGASLQHHAIKVVVDSSADVTVFGFPSQFTQVLLNLMGNARDAILNHAPVQGGVITLAWSSKADQLQLTVADNGGGIPEDILAKIFEPYFSTKPQGSGIGLYMSKLIIEHNMHGQLRAANQTDGAVFTILLPLDEPSE